MENSTHARARAYAHAHTGREFSLGMYAIKIIIIMEQRNL